MSRFRILLTASEALRRLIWEEIRDEPSLRLIVSGEESIVFLNPTDTARDSSNCLSLWLYKVSEHDSIKNTPSGRTGLEPAAPPLALNLHFLATPFGVTPDSSLLLMGKVMEVFNDNTRLVVRNSNDNVFEELRIKISRLTVGEISRVWGALREPYRLSVGYEVYVMHIDSPQLPHSARIVDI